MHARFIKTSWDSRSVRHSKLTVPTFWRRRTSRTAQPTRHSQSGLGTIESNIIKHYVCAAVTARENDEAQYNGSPIFKCLNDRFQRDAVAVVPGNLLWALCFPDSCTNEDIRMSVDRALTPVFRANNISVKVAVPPLMYTSKDTTLEYTNTALIV